jgi:hypothetical protein
LAVLMLTTANRFAERVASLARTQPRTYTFLASLLFIVLPMGNRVIRFTTY